MAEAVRIQQQLSAEKAEQIRQQQAKQKQLHDAASAAHQRLLAERRLAAARAVQTKAADEQPEPPALIFVADSQESQPVSVEESQPVSVEDSQPMSLGDDSQPMSVEDDSPPMSVEDDSQPMSVEDDSQPAPVEEEAASTLEEEEEPVGEATPDEYGDADAAGAASVEEPQTQPKSAATTVLRQWFEKNRAYPFASIKTRQQLARLSNLSLVSVNVWLVNHRKRDLTEQEQRAIRDLKNAGEPLR